MNCRHCKKPLQHVFLDLGAAPPSNAYLNPEDLQKPELYFPLKLFVCEHCWLVQTQDFARADELFTKDYAYFSSVSQTWLEHAAQYCRMIKKRLHLDTSSLVIEIASNDGYLLQYFKEKEIPCLGIEPTSSTASAARQKGIETIEEFFTRDFAASLCDQGKQADLMAANNVLAHVPDINDFVSGFATLLKPDGVATFEFPHLMQLLDYKQFDTIYHEHFSYLSFTTVETVFKANGLSIFDVQELDTHGGSLRVFAQRADTGKHPVTNSVSELMSREKAVGMRKAERYQGFQKQANKVKNDFLGFLLEAKKDGCKVGGYGAAAKGNTLLNFAGVRPDLLPYIVDRNPSKQGKFMPGSRIPIVDEEEILRDKPEYIIILPWNIKDEIMEQLSYVREWGGKFVIAVPELSIV